MSEQEKTDQEMSRATLQPQLRACEADQRDDQQASLWQELDELLVSENGDAPKDALVYGASIGVHRGRVIRYDSGYLFAGVSHINGNLAEDGTITHWMPIPAPPV